MHGTPQKSRKAPTPPKRKVKLSTRVFELECGAFSRVCEDIDTPRSLACWLLANNGEWDQYLQLPRPINEATFADDYLVTEIMRKNPRLPLAIDRSAVAIANFLESEKVCALTNERYRELTTNDTPSFSQSELELIYRVRREVAIALGPLTNPLLDSLPSRSRFGPGASSALSGRLVLPSRKYTCEKHVTPRLLPYFSKFGPRASRGILRAYSSVTTVPKDAQKDRTIAIEPHWNVYYQLGVGSLLRRSLVNLGLDPNNQDRNRRLAASALTRGLATFDLSMASDLIASQVVLTLLPYDWFELLYIGRCDFTEVRGRIIELEKFSSMGNGYTWELQSIIFYSIIKAVCGESFSIDDVGVYGDDLIFPQKFASAMVEALNLFGFKVNTKKSFWQGNFFESCGSDFYKGQDVRPFYFKKDKYHDIHEATIHMANVVRWYAHSRGNRNFCDGRLRRAWFYLARQSGGIKRTHTSYGYTDDGLICNFDECSPSRLRHGHQGFAAKVLFRRPKQSELTDAHGAYLAALDKGSPSGTRLEESSRGSVWRPQLRTIPVFTWYNLGPWV